jgi:hypothetical protein
VALIGIDQPDAYSRMIRFLAAHSGKLTDYAQIARHAGLSVPTVKKYLWFAEKTFIIKPLTPFHTNKVKEITKSPVYYFLDPGFRNFSIGDFGAASLRSDAGFTFQNLVFIELYRQAAIFGWELHFWRTTDGAEVDFIIDQRSSIVPVEVKYTTSGGGPAITRSMRHFIDKYRPGEAWVVSPTYEDETILNGCRVRFRPFYNLVTDDERPV